MRRARFGQRGGFGLLLLVLMGTYVLSAFTTGTWVGAVQIVAFVAVTALSLRAEGIRRRTAHLLIMVAFTGSAAAITLALTHSSDAVSGVAYLWSALMLLLAAGLIVRRILLMPEVSLQSIYGAVSAYLVLGLMFASIYAAMAHFSGQPFFAQGPAGSLKTYQYFSFTTLTTLGYGDYTAAQGSGQAVAVMEALLGQVFLATLVARLVSAFRGTGGRASRAGQETGQAPRAAPPSTPRAKARQLRRARARIGRRL